MSFYFQTNVAGSIIDTPGETTFKQQGVMYLNRAGKICGVDFAVPHIDAYFRNAADPWREAGFPTASQTAILPDSAAKEIYLPQQDDTFLGEICRVATGPLCSKFQCAAFPTLSCSAPAACMCMHV